MVENSRMLPITGNVRFGSKFCKFFLELSSLIMTPANKDRILNEKPTPGYIDRSGLLIRGAVGYSTAEKRNNRPNYESRSVHPGGSHNAPQHERA